MATESGEFREGDLIGGNEIEARIGSGGFGVVYRARAPIGTLIAVKVLTPAGQEDSDAAQRLMKEATLLAEIEHDNVVRFHAAGEDAGRIWLAMEYVSGGTLRQKLPKGHPIDVEQAIRWARQIAEGVAHVHAINDATGRPVVHRDLKPENVLMSRDGVAKVTDFGIAKFRTSLTSSTSNEALGTPLYMAPEQMDATGDIDERADVYALGVILYEMLAGKRPAEVGHEGELTMMEKVTRAILQPPAPLPEVNPAVPEHVWLVVEKALRKKRDERWSSMTVMSGALLAALKRFRRESGKQPSFADLRGMPLSGMPRSPRAETMPSGAPSAPSTLRSTDGAPLDGSNAGDDNDANPSSALVSSRSVKLPLKVRRAPWAVAIGGIGAGISVGLVVFWMSMSRTAPSGAQGAPSVGGIVSSAAPPMLVMPTATALELPRSSSAPPTSSSVPTSSAKPPLAGSVVPPAGRNVGAPQNAPDF